MMNSTQSLSPIREEEEEVVVEEVEGGGLEG
jgi:hypothetical protein